VHNPYTAASFGSACGRARALCGVEEHGSLLWCPCVLNYARHKYARPDLDKSPQTDALVREGAIDKTAEMCGVRDEHHPVLALLLWLQDNILEGVMGDRERHVHFAFEADARKIISDGWVLAQSSPLTQVHSDQSLRDSEVAFMCGARSLVSLTIGFRTTIKHWLNRAASVGAPGDIWDHGRLCAFVQVGEDFPNLKSTRCGGGIYYSNDHISVDTMQCWVLGGFSYCDDFMQARDNDGYFLFRGNRLVTWAQVMEHQRVKRVMESHISAFNSMKIPRGALSSLKLARVAHRMETYHCKAFDNDPACPVEFSRSLFCDEDPASFKAAESLQKTIKAFEEVQPTAEVNNEAKVLDSLHALFSKKNRNGMEAMCHACIMGHHHVVQKMIRAGADLDQPHNKGATALYFASRGGHLSVVQELLDHDADIDLASDNGCTPLHVGCQNGHSPVVLELLERGADMEQANDNGATPLYVGCQQGHLRVVKALLVRGTAFDKARADGSTPLMVAAQQGHLDVIKLLLQHGADTTKKSGTGRTAMDYAKLGTVGAESDVKKTMLQLLSPFRTYASTSEPVSDLPSRQKPRSVKIHLRKKRRTSSGLCAPLAESLSRFSTPQPASKLLPFPVHKKARTLVTPVIPVITVPWVVVGDVLVRSPVTKHEDIKNVRAKWRSEQVRLCFNPAFKLLKESRPGGVTMISTHGEKNVYACKKCRERVLCIGETMRKLDGDLRQLIWDVRSVTPCNCS